MRLRATVKVEIETRDGMDKNAVEAALQRGVSELRQSIQHGGTSTPTGIKSVTAEVSERFFDTD